MLRREDVLPEVVSSAGWTGMLVVILLVVGLLVQHVRASTTQEGLREVWGIVYCELLERWELCGLVDVWRS